MTTRTLGKVTHTSRGFEILEFKDRYGIACELQQSSLAEYEKPGTSAVWLGVADAEPKIMAMDAKALGLPGGQNHSGWVPYAIPDKVLLSTRMHLDRKQVRALIKHLQNWLDNDTFRLRRK